MAKRRGRKPKDPNDQEATLPDDLERSTSAKKKEKKQTKERIIPHVAAVKNQYHQKMVCISKGVQKIQVYRLHQRPLMGF